MNLSCPRKHAHAKDAMLLFIEKCKQNKVTTILDVGAGEKQYHSNDLRREGFEVYTNDFFNTNDFVGSYTDLPTFKNPFDAIWCSHVLEHQLNVNTFLTRIHTDLKEGGILAITVPPAKDNIVGGHVSLWNAGLMLYNLILAGFDCSQASVATYGYNVSVVVQKKSIKLPELVFDSGDIETLTPYFPAALNIRRGSFNVIIERINWK